jgi:hypothetical protein
VPRRSIRALGRGTAIQIPVSGEEVWDWLVKNLPGPAASVAANPTPEDATLVIGAKHNTMDPEHMKWMSTQVQNGSYLYCENGSHMSMYDDQETYMKGLVKFIKEVNEGKMKAVL